MKTDSSPSYVFAGVTRWQLGTQNGVFRMEVGGGQWERMTNGLPADVYVMCITVDPNDRAKVFIGTQYGPYVSTDHGSHWLQLNFPESNVHIWSITVHPTRSEIVFAGASPLGVFRSDDGGNRWRRMPGSTLENRLTMGAFVNRVMRIACDYTHPENVYAVMEVNGAMRSSDGGETWSDCNNDLLRLSKFPHLKSKILTDFEEEGMLDMHALCTTPVLSQSVFIASRMGLFRSDDCANTWHDMSIGRFSPLTYARDIRLSPHDPRMLYATLNVSSSGSTGTLYRSTDLGASWSRFDHGIEAKATVMAIALDPRDPGVVHCATRCGQVFGTRDSGLTWKEYLLPEGSLGTYALAAG